MMRKIVIAGFCTVITAAVSMGAYVAVSQLALQEAETTVAPVKQTASTKALAARQSFAGKGKAALKNEVVPERIVPVNQAETENQPAELPVASAVEEIAVEEIIVQADDSVEKVTTPPVPVQGNTPADVLAALTGRDVESIPSERLTTGKTFCIIAEEAGVLDAFRDEMLKLKKDALTDWVNAGAITQEEADEVIALLEQRQAVCDGTGLGQGVGFGCGYGQGAGLGRGNGAGNGGGNGTGGGRGNRLRDGSCILR